MNIRSATEGDTAAVAEIWRRGWREAHLGRVPDELISARTDESFEVRAVERVEDTWVGVVGDQVAGFVMLAENEVEQVYIAEQARGTGLATRLLAEAEHIVASRGHRRAWLAVVAENARARHFYERQGWIDDGPFDHRAPGPNGPIVVPAHRYIKELTPPLA